MKFKKILVACEESQAVCKAFREIGHEAYSCDVVDATGGRPEWHIKGDALAVAYDKSYNWDMMVCFPPCRYLCSSGLHRNKNNPERQAKTEDALRFVRKLLDAPIKQIALENSVGCISTRIRKPDQTIQPYNFGHDASKRTCLWLKNLPRLVNTKYVEPRVVIDDKGVERLRWANQTDSGQNRLGPSAERSAMRAKTYEGVAKAMSIQWGLIP